MLQHFRHQKIKLHHVRFIYDLKKFNKKCRIYLQTVNIEKHYRKQNVHNNAAKAELFDCTQEHCKNNFRRLSLNLIALFIQKEVFLTSRSTALRQAITRFCTNASEPAAKVGTKSVGWWLVGCSGMVFVAVILGGTVVYGLILMSLMIVISEIIPRTIR